MLITPLVSERAGSPKLRRDVTVEFSAACLLG